MSPASFQISRKSDHGRVLFPYVACRTLRSRNEAKRLIVDMLWASKSRYTDYCSYPFRAASDFFKRNILMNSDAYKFTRDGLSDFIPILGFIC